MKKRKWANNDDEHYGKNFEERLKKAIVNELEKAKDNGQKKKSIVSPVQGIVYYFQYRKSYGEEKAAEYGRDILKFISEYKKNKYMLQYISEDDLEKCAKELSEMAHDMMAVKRYRNIVQK